MLAYQTQMFAVSVIFAIIAFCIVGFGTNLSIIVRVAFAIIGLILVILAWVLPFNL